MTKRAAIYTRISRDRTGEAAGVGRQEADCRAKASALGFDVVRVFTDNDVSAYKKKARPQYQAMLTAIKAGEVDAVIVWHTDRLYRRMADLEGYIAVCGEKRGVPTYTVSAEDRLDLTTPSGRMIARQLGAVAQYESEQKGERQKRANLQRAQDGRFFGTHRCFGYEPDGVTPRPEEADAIREAFALLLDGGSLREVARLWNARGLYGPQKDRPWDGATVSRTVRTARLAGMRTYLDEIVRDDAGEPVETEWPGVVDRDTWWAVQAILNNPARRTTPTHYSQLLLSGVARCAACDMPIQSGGKRKGEARYRCSSKAGHVYRMAEPVDRYVTNLVLARLTQPDAATTLVPSTPEVDVDSLRREAAAIHTRMDELGAAFADGLISRSQLLAGTQRAEARLQAIEDAMPAHQPEALTRLVSARDVRKVWESFTLDAQRSVIDALMVVRLVAPGTKEQAYVWDNGVRGVNPDTVQVEWRG